MKSLLLVLLLASPAVAADGFTTVKEFQSDFAAAKQCHSIAGRKVWQGQKAFYMQSRLTTDSAALDPENANVVLASENTKAVVQSYEKACK